MGENGWTFDPAPETIPDDVNHASKLYELYTIADPTLLRPLDDPDPLGQEAAHDRLERIVRDHPDAQ